MLSKEEIEKAKEITQNYIKDTPIAPYDCLMNEERKSAETLLQYIQELEVSNKNLDHENNRLEKIEFERDMSNKVIDEMVDTIVGNKKILAITCNHIIKMPNNECEKQNFIKKVEEE